MPNSGNRSDPSLLRGHACCTGGNVTKRCTQCAGHAPRSAESICGHCNGYGINVDPCQICRPAQYAGAVAAAQNGNARPHVAPAPRLRNAADQSQLNSTRTNDYRRPGEGGGCGGGSGIASSR
ncbi:hypothetical protein AJ80_05725 [Polytolypa hystricis UAMH7299]|uniref:Uncharacterized protein n=1 Tax=Polytolypa hystricis (strain UAMH7299) TaxID=1447883 RepID=A0A2B7Y276_POLH7|nr:hypothetical protein AJ80_05725 [Polytolypa hystricis UAMH7299]